MRISMHVWDLVLDADWERQCFGRLVHISQLLYFVVPPVTLLLDNYHLCILRDVTQ
jgi:hypothetical protein